ncbi:uncharacterized protein LOC110114674 [Dendrobium catenatum]|uniref:uncharacterized protein LOC110114674 n=1 Tax=Dendrobium catenatum TaxID=906689 RepID=UPI00109F7287|nr:uncharacterized protein LOC110114674 [Dendrobium catenatum]
MQKLLTALQSTFSMRNLGTLHSFLGLQATYTNHGMHLSQYAYATDLLRKAAMSDCKPVSTPLPTKFFQSVQPDCPYDRPDHYRQITGALQYLTLTRPDLLYAVNFLCQHMHAPMQSHYLLLKRVLRYVKGTLTLGLPIHSSTLELTGYADSDWATNPDDQRSITGYCALKRCTGT